MVSALVNAAGVSAGGAACAEMGGAAIVGRIPGREGRPLQRARGMAPLAHARVAEVGESYEFR